jgi:hypothetical protein
MRRAETTARLWLATTFAALQCACGGGGAGGSPPLQSQSISFAQAGPLYVFVGDGSFSNLASGGSGTGAITYSTDTPAAASVNATSGLVTINGAGVAEITATKAGDSTYQSATAVYQVRVAPRSVTVTGWIGPDDAQVSVGSVPLSFELAHSTDPNCDPSAVLGCANGAQAQTSSTPLVDPTTTLTQPSVYWLEHGPNISSGVTVPAPGFDGSNVEGSVVVNGTLWELIIGSAGNEIWSSQDGANWVQVATNVLGVGVAQADAHLLYNANAFWIVVGTPTQNQVWSSADGKNWAQLAITANFPPKVRFGAASFNGRLWVFGGANSNGNDQKDLWSSSDGISWVENNAAVLPYGREQMAMLAFNGKLWIIGGYNGTMYADVWSSPDGATWTEVNASAAFGVLFAERVVTDGTQMWLFGGFNGQQVAQQGIWSSPDGVNWTLIATPLAVPDWGYNFDVAWWNGSFWALAGADGEVWSSRNATQWNIVTVNARLPETSALMVAGYQGKVWAVGVHEELYSSPDGINWSTAVSSLPGPGATNLVAMPDSLIMITAWADGAPNYDREVWQSTDGVNWTEIASSVPFNATVDTKTVYYDGKLWVFSTNMTDGVTPEIWWTTDGVNWTLASSDPAFAPRTSYQVLAYNNHMYVVGGSINGTPQTDVWTSTDGANWTSVGTTSGLPAQDFNASLVLAGSMCVLTGVAPYPARGVWCSSDGINWSNVANNAPNGPIAQVNGEFYVIGNGVGWTEDFDLVWKSSDGITWRLGYQNNFNFP